MTRLTIDLSDPQGHVTNYSFGKEPVRDGALQQLYTELGAVRPITAELMLRDAYITDYQIRPHNAPKHPLDVVRLYDKEDVVEGGAVRSLMRKYKRYGIKEQWGLSYKEFMALPYDEAMFILEDGEADALRKVDAAIRLRNETQRDLEKQK